MLTDSHEKHQWGMAGFCVACPARKCGQWRCPAPRVAGRSKCSVHTNGLTQTAPIEVLPVPSVRVPMYSLPAARRAELR